MAVPSPRRFDFEPDGIPNPSTSRGEQAPAISSSTALARFEFEHGRGNEGTKVLMVEWEDDGKDSSKSNTGDWEVSWEGKTTVLSARDGAEGKLHRLYFLLPPGANIPRIVKVAQAGGKTLQTNPLPAIFPAELGLSATTAGRRGVLHTIYAKQRLSALQKEIEIEMRTNGEGVGLEMAVQEKQWIEENFGVAPKIIPDLQYSISPVSSPRTPGGGRISEKGKRLKLGTSASELSVPSSVHVSPGAGSHPLSPDMGDVAVSSFSLFHSGLSRPQTRPVQTAAQKNESSDGNRMNSLDSVATGEFPKRDDSEMEEGLFAVKLSPRSPEMTKSPFSFTKTDTAPWLKDNE